MKQAVLNIAYSNKNNIILPKWLLQSIKTNKGIKYINDTNRLSMS